PLVLLAFEIEDFVKAFGSRRRRSDTGVHAQQSDERAGDIAGEGVARHQLTGRELGIEHEPGPDPEQAYRVGLRHERARAADKESGVGRAPYALEQAHESRLVAEAHLLLE